MVCSLMRHSGSFGWAAPRPSLGPAVNPPIPAQEAVMFLIAVGFWNFLGAGVFGFLINLPVVSY